MIKLFVIVALAALACRLVFGKWPWEFLRAPSTHSQALFRARKLLGVSPSASQREIRDAHRRLAAMMHPDRGGSDARLAEINAARDLLLDALPPDTREPPE